MYRKRLQCPNPCPLYFFVQLQKTAFQLVSLSKQGNVLKQARCVAVSVSEGMSPRNSDLKLKLNFNLGNCLKSFKMSSFSVAISMAETCSHKGSHPERKVQFF